jgi:hypothetical protein
MLRRAAALYLPRLISGEWSGTMNLTEPQAGSDVGALRTGPSRGDGTYAITGQKIYITWGDAISCRTSATSCSPGCRARPGGPAASACSSSRATSPTRTASPARATPSGS